MYKAQNAYLLHGQTSERILEDTYTLSLQALEPQCMTALMYM